MKRVDPLHFVKKIFGGLIIIVYICCYKYGVAHLLNVSREK